MKELKPKPYYRIGEVAKHLGVHTHVLRYWESEFPQLGPTRAPSGHRLYKAADLEKLGQLKELLHVQGYTLAGAKRHLEDLAQKKSQPPPAGPQEPVQSSLALDQPATHQSQAQDDMERCRERQDILAELKDILRILN